jgi:geranylgeranyl pyrophosphate synthase
MNPQNSDLKRFLGSVVSNVDAELERLIPEATVDPVRLHKAIRHSLFAGGKRFRPALVFAVGEALGAAKSELVTFAAAVEMIHTYSLIHDDLPSMDDDELRRGRATCHVKFGEATAILAGDALQTLAVQSIAEATKLSAEQRTRLIAELSKASGTPGGMVAGQQLDLEGEGRSVTVVELETIHRCKTGAMIEVSAKGGAIIAGASGAVLEAVTEYASLLGLLFQITDDILDVTQTTAILGKTAGKDEIVAKATYPSFYGIEKTRELAEEVHAKAIAGLEQVGESEILKAIAEYVLEREK